jgi:hypothetical protein
MSGIVRAIKKVVKGVVKAVKGVVKAVVKVVSSVVSFVTQPFLGLFGGYDAPDAQAEADRQQGVQLTRQGSETAIPVVYGYRKVGGAITFAETGSTNNQYLWVAYVLSEGTIEGLREMFIDDNQLPETIIRQLNNGQTVDITTGKYAGRVQLQFSHGIYNSDPSVSNLGTWSICSDAPSWKNSMVYNGMAVVFARYYWKKIETNEDSEANPFSGSIPDVKACILGKKVAALTGTPQNYTYANAPTRYSTNPAECILDYLRNPRYGKGLVNDDIDWASWQATSTKFNTVVEYVSGISGPIHTFNFVVNTGNTIFNNIKTMLPNCRAYMPYIQGKFKLRVEDAGNDTDITSGVATIVATFDKDNIVGDITYGAVEAGSKYNQVSVTYVNPDNKWSNDTVVYPETEAERQTYIDKDGGRVNKLDATFGALTNYAIAKDMAKLIFNKSRFQESAALTVTSQGLELEVGDNIRIQSHMLNFGTTPWRIVSIKYNNDMSVALACVRNPDSIYPHTRVGEEDIVLPTYTPKGASIIYPEFDTTIPIGLVPPTNGVVPIVHLPPSITGVSPQTFGSPGINAVTVSGINFQTGLSAVFIGDDGTQYTPNSTSLNSTSEVVIQTIASMDSSNQPYDVQVQNTSAFGSLSARQNNVLRIDGTTGTPDDPIQDPPVVEDPEDPGINPPPSDPPPEGEPPTNPPGVVPEPLPLTDIADITVIDYSAEGALVYADIYFRQPQNPAYLCLQVYYQRQGRDEPWRYLEVKDRPGPGETASFKLGPFAANSRSSITVRTRVKYGSGEYSTKINSVFLTPGAAVDTNEPKDFIETVGPGWTPPETSTTTDRDNTFSKVEARTQLSGGTPKSPREIDFTLTQEIYNDPINFAVNGVKIYYKPTIATVWNYQEFLFGTTQNDYVPGTANTVTMSVFGNPIYPSAPTPEQQQYDFILRLTYKDGKESVKQVRFEGLKVEVNAFGFYDFDPTYGAATRTEDHTAVNIVLADPNAPSTKDLITVGVHTLFPDYDNPNIRLFLSPPDSSFLLDWAGIKVRTRIIEPGTDPEFEETVITKTGLTAEGLWFDRIPITYEDEYEVVITPLYWNGSSREEAKFSWLGASYITDRQQGADIPSNGFPPNFKEKYNFKLLTTADALVEVDKPFPAPVNPRINVEEWSLNIPKSNFNGPNGYFKLVFSHAHIGGYTQLNVYRRYYKPNNSYGGYTLNKLGAGRWEKVQVTTTNSGGTVTAHLKYPLSYQEYNGYFDPAKAVSNSNQLRRYPGWVDGFTGENFEYVAVAQTSGGESSIALRLPPISATFNGTRQGVFIPNPGDRITEIDPLTLSVYPTVLEKNLDQAIAPLADSARLWNRKAFTSFTLTSVSPGRL